MTNEDCGKLKKGDVLYYVCESPRFGRSGRRAEVEAKVKTVKVEKVTEHFVFVERAVDYTKRIARDTGGHSGMARFFTTPRAALEFEELIAEQLVAAARAEALDAEQYLAAITALKAETPWVQP